jgi:hypothetical protein
MGNNFHTSPTSATKWSVTDVEAILDELDDGITFKDPNKIVHCDGIVHYNKTSGVLTWSDILRIAFTRADGTININTVTANNVTLTDGQFVYVDLSDTDNQNHSNLTVAALPAVDSASNIIPKNRVVIGYRNSASDEFVPVWLKNLLIKKSRIGYKTVAVTVTTGNPSGASGNDADLVGGEIIGIVPTGNQDQFVDNVTIDGNGAVTVTLAAAATADNTFKVTVLRN